MAMRMQLVRKPNNSGFYSWVAINKSAHGDVYQNVIKEVIQMHEDIVNPWELEEDRPEFTYEFERKSQGLLELRVLMTSESAEQATLSVWQLLNREEGTEVRPMHVSSDWISKTTPRGLSSGPGAGHKTGIYPPWAEGIEGREFDMAVAEHMEPFADEAVREAYEMALDKEFSR